MKQRYWWLSGIAVVAMAVAGCSGGGDNSPTPPQPPTTLSSSQIAQQSADATALQAEAEAADRTARANVHSLEVRLQKEPTADGKLDLIMTRYCQLGGGPSADSTEKSTERLLLEELFDKYWQAGGKWYTPIWQATKQPGACPAEFPTSPPAPAS